MVGFNLNHSILLRLLTYCLSLSIPFLYIEEAHAEANLYQQSQGTKVLGKKTGADIISGVGESGVSNGKVIQQPQIMAITTLRILGAAIYALQAYMSPPNTYDGVTYSEFYSLGKRIYSQSGGFDPSGGLQFNLGLAPTEYRVPFIVYPIGPLLLEIDGGARFLANLSGQATPNLGIPLSISTLGVSLEAQAMAAGFIEGYGKLFIVRAGVGGILELIHARAMINARISFDGNPPIAFVDVMAEFLKGRFYAFFDFFSIFQWGWKRLWNHDLYSWRGYCYASGAMVCPSS